MENPLIIAVRSTRTIPLFFIRIFKDGEYKKIMVKVYCLGNKYISEDGMALRFVGKKIKDFEFVEYNQDIEGDIVIMDVCKGLKEMKILDFDRFLERHPVSAHDFDIGMELKLLQATGQINKVGVVAIPFEYSYEQVLKKLKDF